MKDFMKFIQGVLNDLDGIAARFDSGCHGLRKAAEDFKEASENLKR
jgi:hypothetical protein